MTVLAMGNLSTDTVSDEELVARAKSGDGDALNILVKAYLPKVYNKVQALVPEADADDVTQEVFLSLVDSIWRFNYRSTFSTWLYRIMKNKVVDYYRKKGRNREIELVDHHDYGNVDPWDAVDSELMVKAALANLPDAPRELLLMRFHDGLSFHEMGNRLGLGYEAVRSRYRRALHMVKENMERKSVLAPDTGSCVASQVILLKALTDNISYL